MHSFRNEFFTCLFKIQNVQVIQNDVIKCCKIMSSNVAKWCHHIATSQQRGEIVFHVVMFKTVVMLSQVTCDDLIFNLATTWRCEKRCTKSDFGDWFQKFRSVFKCNPDGSNFHTVLGVKTKNRYVGCLPCVSIWSLEENRTVQTCQWFVRG